MSGNCSIYNKIYVNVPVQYYSKNNKTRKSRPKYFLDEEIANLFTHTYASYMHTYICVYMDRILHVLVGIKPQDYEYCLLTTNIQSRCGGGGGCKWTVSMRDKIRTERRRGGSGNTTYVLFEHLRNWIQTLLSF